jgi:hypothetical protein
MKQGCLYRGVTCAEHRAFIVARKSGKLDGAKGGRKVDE